MIKDFLDEFERYRMIAQKAIDQIPEEESQVSNQAWEILQAEVRRLTDADLNREVRKIRGIQPGAEQREEAGVRRTAIDAPKHS